MNNHLFLELTQTKCLHCNAGSNGRNCFRFLAYGVAGECKRYCYVDENI